MTQEQPKRSFADELKIRVNPHYDHTVDPENNEFSYWNPVSANNDLVKMANATLEITSQISQDMAVLLKVRVAKKEAEHLLEVFERDLLVKEPPSASETKTNKLVAAAVQRRAVAAGLVETYTNLVDTIHQSDQAEMKLNNRIDRAHLWLKTAERVSDNIKTALSFYKDERKHDYTTRT